MLPFGVSPEVRIVKINTNLHPIAAGPFAELYGRRYIVISAALAFFVFVIGIIPYTEADIVYSGLCKGLKYILFFSGKIIIFDAAVFFD